MDFNEKNIKNIALTVLIALLSVLVFLIIRPVILSIVAGLILAYVFLPIHRRILPIIKNKNLSAFLVSIFVLLLIAIPLWFVTPIVIKQVYETYQVIQGLDVQGFIINLFPTAEEQFTSQLTVTIEGAISKVASVVLNSLVEYLINFPTIALHLVLVAFVFFFTLRDKDELKEFVQGLSPFKKHQETALVTQFKNITESIVYGQILIGLVQGVFAGIGFLIFGVPNALLLTLLAVLLSVIPVVGPSIVYLPVGFYFLSTGEPLTALIFLLYNLLIVSSIDNVMRAHIVSKRTNLSQVIVLIGMIGGWFIFGVLGLIIGPLILAYFITFLRAYKEYNLLK